MKGKNAMSTEKTIVCLANSRKPPGGGRCIAGKEQIAGGFGGWIRPVSARPSHEISDEERRYEDGIYPSLLDVVSIELGEKSPVYHQKENIIFDDRYYWQKVGQLEWSGLRTALDQPESLWTNGDSTYHGINDRVKFPIAVTLSESLYLIEPENLRIRVREESAYIGPSKRKVRAFFTYRGEDYGLAVTDPEQEQSLFARPNAEYVVTDSYLSISLSEPNSNGDGHCFKLVAAIIGRVLL